MAIPPLSLSTGPAVSDAQSGLGSASTGDFIFKPKAGLIESLVPWAALVVVAWFVTRK